jgi:dolichol-phosphate mannosyltransferase
LLHKSGLLADIPHVQWLAPHAGKFFNQLMEIEMKLSIVIPCYNEERTLERCVDRVMAIADASLNLEVIIVDDCSKDRSFRIAQELESKYSGIIVLKHEVNQGKGAALRTGFKKATGDFVAVQDADLEYDPEDLKKLLVPLSNGLADVVLGSRFLSSGYHRVLYFWHYMGNLLLTLVSNMFTDLNLTDMETCYKVFRREVIQRVNIKENRFGFEPEIVAKISAMRLRIFEMGISYSGRTYQEGKKIGVKDGFRALYCIFRYNASRAPLPIQFLLYLFVGSTAAVFNLGVFLGLLSVGAGTNLAVAVAFILAAILNYLLCILLIFRRKSRWTSVMELIAYCILVGILCLADIGTTRLLLLSGFGAGWAKALASMVGLIFNFLGRRYVVFPEPAAGPWMPSGQTTE